MERQRRKDAEQERDARPAITRKQARAWLDLASEHGFNAVPSTGSVEYVAALALAKFADGIATDLSTTLGYVAKITDERDSARAKAIEEALAAINNIGCAARVRDGAGDWIETIGRRETYLAIRALADRGAK